MHGRDCLSIGLQPVITLFDDFPVLLKDGEEHDSYPQDQSSGTFAGMGTEGPERPRALGTWSEHLCLQDYSIAGFWNVEGGWILDIWMKGSQQA